MTNPVIVMEYPCLNGSVLGHIRLNNPRAINAITLPMIDGMQLALDNFSRRDDVVAVFIDGEGEKGFCAGGDIRQMYQSAQANINGPAHEAEVFFEREYRLNLTLHQYPKPLIVLGHGVLMGGGMGLFEPCDYRLVTPSTRIAMPEIAIALYPDVGASYFLNRWPYGSGLFLALTGTSINAKDALDFTIATHSLADGSVDSLISALTTTIGTDSVDSAIELAISSLALSPSSLPDAQMASHIPLMEKIAQCDNLKECLTIIGDQADSNDQWLARAVKSMQAGSLLSIAWTYEQLMRSKSRDLIECFKSEMVLSANTVKHPEFSEGVRALIIDKDKEPRWMFNCVDDISKEYLATFFEPPWVKNPLEDMH